MSAKVTELYTAHALNSTLSRVVKPRLVATDSYGSKTLVTSNNQYYRSIVRLFCYLNMLFAISMIIKLLAHKNLLDSKKATK